MKLITAANLIGAIGLVVASTGACASPASDESTTSTLSGRLGAKQGMENPQGAQGPQYQQGQQGPQFQPGQQGPQFQQGQQGPQYQQGQQGPQGGTGTEAGQQEQVDQGGVTGLIADGLSRLQLTDDQRRKVDELGKRVVDSGKPVARAGIALRNALAEQLRSGHIDEHQLDDEIDALVRAREEASPVLRSALADLHGVLDPNQRGQLADAITDRMDRSAHDSEQWFDQLAQDLQLTDDQKQRVHEVLDRMKPSVERDRDTMRHVVDAFKGEEFDIDQMLPREDTATRTRERARGMIGNARELASILTPEQRARLADKLEQSGEREQQAGPQQGGPGQYGPGQGVPGQGGPQQGAPGQFGPQQGAPGQFGPQQGAPGQFGPQQGAPGQFGPQQGAPGQFGPQQGIPQPPQQERVGEAQDRFVVGGGFRAGGYRAGFGGWGAGYGWGGARVTVARGGYVGGYPFIGGYAPFIW